MFEDREDCQYNTFWADTKKLRRREISSYLVSAAAVLLALCLQAVDNRYLSTQNPSTAFCPVREHLTLTTHILHMISHYIRIIYKLDSLILG